MFVWRASPPTTSPTPEAPSRSEPGVPSGRLRRAERERHRVSRNGRTLAQQTVELASGSEASADLDVTPSAAGLYRYTVNRRPPSLAKRRRATNSRTVAVRGPRRLAARAPARRPRRAPDLTALRATLESDRSLDVTVRTQRGPGEFLRGRPASRARPVRPARARGLPRRGGPTPARRSAWRRRSARALPVVFVLNASRPTFPASPTRSGMCFPYRQRNRAPASSRPRSRPTPAGAEHPVLSEIRESRPLGLRALPPLGRIAYAVGRSQPGARSARNG